MSMEEQVINSLEGSLLVLKLWAGWLKYQLLRKSDEKNYRPPSHDCEVSERIRWVNV